MASNDEIHIHRQFKDSYLPTRYVVSGGTFVEMKDAVKATPGARFDGTMKSWLIVGQSVIDGLTARGWTVERVSAVRYDWQGTQAVWRDDAMRFQDSLARVLETNETVVNVYTHVFDPRFGHDMTFGAPTIYIHITADEPALAMARAQEAATRAQMEQDLGMDMSNSPVKQYGGWLTVVNVAGKAATAHFVKVFNAVYSAGGKTQDAYRAALNTLEDLDSTGRSPKVAVVVRVENDQLITDVHIKEV